MQRELEGIHLNWQNFDACGIVGSIYSNRVVDRWNQLDQQAVDASSILLLQDSLDSFKRPRMSFFIS